MTRGPARCTGTPDAGVTAVETAIVLPVLLLMLFGALDLALWAFATQQAAGAARDGSRQAIISPADGGAVRAAAQSRVPTVALDPADVTTVCSGACRRDDTVTVTVTWDREWLTPLGVLLGQPGTTEIRGTSTRHLPGVPTAP